MTQELLYTSAPRGLKPGSRGFCTVVCTQGMSPPLATALESLSAYRHVYPPGDANAVDNPVAWSHIKLTVGGRPYSVMSRVSDYGLDYSQRGNKIAHHVVLDPREQTPGGPAWLLAQPGFMQSDWDGEPRVLSAGRPTRRGSHPAGICAVWKEATSDAGWAGVLAESFLANPERQAYIVFKPGINLLPLLVEAIGLLPPERRWDVTFSTYFTNIPPGATCNWRCVLAGSPESLHASRFSSTVQISLCEPLPAAKGGILVDSARTGIRPLEIQPQPHVQDREEWTDEALLDELGEFAIDQPPAATGVNVDRSDYPVQDGRIRPPGMPPPPPSKNRRTLASLYTADTTRRRRRVIIGAIAALCVFVGGGLWVYFATGLFQHLELNYPQVAEPNNTEDKRGISEKTDVERNQNNSAETNVSTSDHSKPAIAITVPEPPETDSVPGSKADDNPAQLRPPAATSSVEASGYLGKPVNNPVTVTYKKENVTPSSSQGFYFIPAEFGRNLKIDAVRSETTKWQFLFPECFETQLGKRMAVSLKINQSSNEAAIVSQPLNGQKQNTRPGLYTISRGTPSSPIVIKFKKDWETPLADCLQWGTVQFTIDDKSPPLFVVLHALVVPPTYFAGGSLTWQFDAWGGVSPELSVEELSLRVRVPGSDIQLDFKAGPSVGRLECTESCLESMDALFGDNLWQTDASPPVLNCAFDDDNRHKRLRITAEITETQRWKKDCDDMAQRLMKAGVYPKFVQLDTDFLTGPRSNDLLSKVKSKEKETLAAVNAAKSQKDEHPEKYTNAKNAHHKAEVLLEDVPKLKARAVTLRDARERLKEPRVASGKVYYRVQGRDEKIYLVNFRH